MQSRHSSSMRRLVVVLLTLSLALLSATATAGAARKPKPKPPPFPRLPAGTTHAEINVKIGRVPHTLILDRGRIVQVSLTGMTVLESDGTREQVPLDDQTIVQFRKTRLTTAALRRGMNIDAMRIDDGAAVRVRIRSLPRRLRGLA